MDPATTELIGIWGPYAVILIAVTGYFVKKERDFHKERLEYTNQLLKIIKDTSEILSKVTESIEKLTEITKRLSESANNLKILRRFMEHVVGVVPGKTEKFYIGEDEK
jgi:hypothetical protein